MGQVVFGLLGLYVAMRSIELLSQPPAMILSLVASFSWLAITFLFMAYWEPKLNVAIVCVLMIAAALTAH